jgi:hypothetical protein
VAWLTLGRNSKKPAVATWLQSKARARAVLDCSSAKTDRRRAVLDLSLLRSEFTSRVVRGGFIVERVALGYVLSKRCCVPCHFKKHVTLQAGK